MAAKSEPGGGALVGREPRVGEHLIGAGGRTFFLVEEGQANNGDFDLALRMVELAARTGADGVEFQLAIADDFYVRSHPNHAVYRAREFSRKQLEELAAAAAGQHLVLSGSPLSDALVGRLVEAGFPLLNVNSSDLTNPRMLDAAAGAGVPFLIGTAMATVEEIDWAVERLSRRGGARFCLLHGQHIMTTADGRGVPEHEVSLATIGYLRDRYGVPVGFTDHTSSPVVAALAAAHGAAVVTKHLAPQEGWRGPDWQVCLTPTEMAECVRLVRLADTARGSLEKSLAFGELADRKQMRRSIVANRDLPPGTTLSAEHLALKRPGTGLDPRQLEAVTGRTLAAALGKDELLTLEHLA